MNKFIARFAAGLAGVVSGFDRLVFRGTLRRIRYGQGMMGYLWQQQVLLKDFGGHVQQVSERIKAAPLQAAEEQGRPIQYLYSSQVSKDEVAPQDCGSRQGGGRGGVSAELCRALYEL